MPQPLPYDNHWCMTTSAPLLQPKPMTLTDYVAAELVARLRAARITYKSAAVLAGIPATRLRRRLVTHPETLTFAELSAIACGALDVAPSTVMRAAEAAYVAALVAAAGDAA